MKTQKAEQKAVKQTQKTEKQQCLKIQSRVHAGRFFATPIVSGIAAPAPVQCVCGEVL